MKNLLIDILPAKGHFHATLKMASILRDAGIEVAYGSQPPLQPDVERFAYAFLSLPPVNIAHLQFWSLPDWSNFLDQFFETLLPVKQKQLKEDIGKFIRFFAESRFDLVLLDEQSALKALIYEKIGIKVVLFQTKPDTRRISGQPPFTSVYVPREGTFSSFICSFLWDFKLASIFFFKAFSRISSFGNDTFTMYRRICQDMHIDPEHRIELARSFGIGVKGFPRLVISPAAFDFPHPETKGVFRIGPLIDVKREASINLPRYHSLLLNLEQTKQKQRGMVVYCSLGTVTSGFKKKVKKFFMRIKNVAKKDPDILFILSTGKDFDINQLLPSPPNLMVFDSVPQVDLLRHCHLMITHGGMNSITECIFNEVPMLVFPLSPYWDQPGNSARVAFHKLGMKGSIRWDTANSIFRKIDKVRGNYAFYIQNVAKMKKRFEENNGSTQIVTILQNFFKSP